MLGRDLQSGSGLGQHSKPSEERIPRSLARAAALSPRLASEGTKSQEAVRLTHGIDAALKVVEVLVERIAVQLDARQLVDRRRRDPERFLQAFEDALAVPERRLGASAKYLISNPCRLATQVDSLSKRRTLSLSLASRPGSSICHHK